MFPTEQLEGETDKRSITEGRERPHRMQSRTWKRLVPATQARPKPALFRAAFCRFVPLLMALALLIAAKIVTHNAGVAGSRPALAMTEVASTHRVGDFCVFAA